MKTFKEFLIENNSSIKYSVRTMRDGSIFISASDPSRLNAKGQIMSVGHLHVPTERMYKNTFSVGDVWISEQYRRQGVASKMYELAEKKLGMKAEPSEWRSPEAIMFWNKRNNS
jgi:ribosomal protein S18 acetylase RimI-like enzyme